MSFLCFTNTNHQISYHLLRKESLSNNFTNEMPKLAFSLGESILTDARFNQKASGKGRNKSNLQLRNKEACPLTPAPSKRLMSVPWDITGTFHM